MVIDVAESDFQKEVIDRSRELPVVVDFWAEWCGPCRALSPALEAAAKNREGKVVLAKVDTDANPNISRDMGIQGIPAVKAFRDGEIVSEFVGAQPPAMVERFFDELVPSEAEELVRSGDEESLRRALELEPGRADAALALARLLMARGDEDEALALLENVAGSFAAEGVAARIRLGRNPDLDLADAFAALDSGDHGRALELLEEAIRDAGDDETRDDLRALMVGIFDELGADDPLAREYRRKLAAALY
jgi:putative thioredoxin